MVHVQVSDDYIHFVSMYTTDHILPVLTIKHLVNKYGEPTMPHKLSTETKPSVSNQHVLFCKCVVQKATTHTDTKALNIRHGPQNKFYGIFVGIPQHQKWYLIYVPSTRKTLSSNAVVFEK